MIEDTKESGGKVILENDEDDDDDDDDDEGEWIVEMIDEAGEEVERCWI